MSRSTDDRGRLYLPTEVRERFGERYRIVELPSHVALFPVDEDPLEGYREAVGDAFAGEELADVTAEAGAATASEVGDDGPRGPEDHEE